jgi:hypothetical protein
LAGVIKKKLTTLTNSKMNDGNFLLNVRRVGVATRSFARCEPSAAPGL